ncbi:hypothetical protein ACIQOV_11425, partial [Kitasatospora sp. NPDC091257]
MVPPAPVSEPPAPAADPGEAPEREDREDRDERPQYVLPLVVRMERATPPGRTDALETSARAVRTTAAPDTSGRCSSSPAMSKPMVVTASSRS